ncbi:sulfurtransferase [Lysobacter humi (ex Lee et al. 2017)]
MLLNVAAYHFVRLDAPEHIAGRLREACEAGGVRGTVLVAPEGVNLFLAGEAAAVEAVLALLTDDARFARLEVKRSWSRAQPFGRLKVKLKPEIITYRRDGTAPLEGRAPAVDPATLARWIEQGHDDAGRRLVLLDTRNREEVAHGTFAGALTLPIDNFTDLPAALEPHRESLADATVVSFCTGGIRCEKAALHLQADGMANVLQLDGGILGYFERVGGYGYAGRCFVFDGRVALDPALAPLVDDGA